MNFQNLNQTASRELSLAFAIAVSLCVIAWGAQPAAPETRVIDFADPSQTAGCFFDERFARLAPGDGAIKPSLRFDTFEKGGEWNACFNTKPGLFQPGKSFERPGGLAPRFADGRRGIQHRSSQTQDGLVAFGRRLRRESGFGGQLIRPPGSERPTTCTADHIHSGNSLGFLKMENCEFSRGE